MSTMHNLQDWLSKPPRGKFQEHVRLKNRTWLKVGGAARWFFQPADTQDLADLLAQYPADAPIYCLGVGSNTLIRDGGIDALVIHLAKPFAEIQMLDPHRLKVGAGVRSLTLAKHAASAGLAGLSFLAGIPGSIGGALAMNAGAHGGQTFDHLEAVQWMDRSGKQHHLMKDQLDFGYRHCGLVDGVFLSAIFCCLHAAPEALLAEITNVQQRRADTQPVGVSTGGSTFVNPTVISPVTGEKHSAWQWIDAAGCRGLRVGGAVMSEKHCNFMINTGEATAADFENLAETVRKKVMQKFGITLEWEIRRVGAASADKEIFTQGKDS